MLVPGTILQGRYRIISTLGAGGMGAVYLAEDQRLPGRQCAIKENLPDPNASPQALAQARQQFLVEASVLARLDHPNLPKVSDYFSEGGREYLVMDYVEGEDLESALRRVGKPLPEKPALIWAEQVLDALDYLHNQRPRPVIHRDVKPANIRLTPQGKVKLVDFGLVKLLDPNDPRTATAMKGMGTPEYAPLEQYAGAGHTDARSDIYSLGATLYHLLTNVTPPGIHQRLLNPSLLAPPRQRNPALSVNTEQAILKAMEIHPDQRFQTAREMKQALAVIGDLSVTPGPGVACPQCGRISRAGARFCGSCGHSFAPVASAPARGEPESPTARRRPGTWPRSRRTPTPQISSIVPGRQQVSLSTRCLDFGTVLPGRIRWQKLTVNNQGGPTTFEFSVNEVWIVVSPSRFTCAPGERRTVGVSINTRGLPLYTVHEGELILRFPSDQERVSVRVKVEPLSRMRLMLIGLFNMLLGNLLGLIIIGLLGNLALRLLGYDFNIALLTYGAVIAGFVFTVVGFRVQDTVNLALGVTIGILVWSLVGSGLGALLGVGMSLLLSNWSMVPIITGWGLLAGSLVGAAYIYTKPEKWGIWLF